MISALATYRTYLSIFRVQVYEYDHIHIPDNAPLQGLSEAISTVSLHSINAIV